MRERTRRRLAWAAALGATASLGVTITAIVVPYHPGPTAGTVGMVEVASLLALLGLVIRWVPAPWMGPVSALAGIASATWILRFLPDPTVLTALGAVAVWSAGPALAAVAGGYPRTAENRRERAVDDARRRQRLDLARDLHDFVAHDVTGIVIQAQAAQAAGRRDAETAFTALERIERAGLTALASMDSALDLLRREDEHQSHPGAPADVRQPDLTHLPALVTGFATADAQIVLDLDPRLPDSLPQEISALAYRLVVEALTNVRRHAPASTTVEIAVRPVDDPSGLTVYVDNDLPEPGVGRRFGPRRHGSGLVDLGRKVRDHGGAFDAGPVGDHWRVEARLPVPTTRPTR